MIHGYDDSTKEKVEVTPTNTINIKYADGLSTFYHGSTSSYTMEHPSLIIPKIQNDFPAAWTTIKDNWKFYGIEIYVDNVKVFSLYANKYETQKAGPSIIVPEGAVVRIEGRLYHLDGTTGEQTVDDRFYAICEIIELG